MDIAAPTSPRERIALPLWTGILGAFGATLVGFAGALGIMIVLMVGAYLAIHKMPLATPGHPLVTLTEFLFYVCCGLFAWRRLDPIRTGRVRRFDRADARVLLLGASGLIVIRIITVAQLALTHQMQHEQAGFEHFTMLTRIPAVTALNVAVTVVTLVLIGPLVEELVFRGLLFGGLLPKLRLWPSAIVVALLFGLVHADPVLFPSLALLGLLTALTYAVTGNLLVSATLHALNNLLGAVVLLTATFRAH